MFDKLLTRAHTQAQNELDEQLSRQRQTIQVSLTALRSLGRIILDDAISDEELRTRLFAAAQRSALAESVSAIAGLDTSSRWGQGRAAASSQNQELGNTGKEPDNSAESKHLTSIRWDDFKIRCFPVNNCLPRAFHPFFMVADVGFGRTDGAPQVTFEAARCQAPVQL